MNRSDLIDVIKGQTFTLSIPQVRTLFYMIDKRAEQGICEAREITEFYGWTDQMTSKVLNKLIGMGLVVECGKRPRSVVKLYKVADAVPVLEDGAEQIQEG